MLFRSRKVGVNIRSIVFFLGIGSRLVPGLLLRLILPSVPFGASSWTFCRSFFGCCCERWRRRRSGLLIENSGPGFPCSRPVRPHHSLLAGRCQNPPWSWLLSMAAFEFAPQCLPHCALHIRWPTIQVLCFLCDAGSAAERMQSMPESIHGPAEHA